MFKDSIIDPTSSGVLGVVSKSHSINFSRPSWVLDGGWTDWLIKSPPEGKLIQIMREDWDEPLLFTRANPSKPEYQYQMYMNVSGLYWRLTGIGKGA